MKLSTCIAVNVLVVRYEKAFKEIHSKNYNCSLIMYMDFVPLKAVLWIKLLWTMNSPLMISSITEPSFEGV